MINSVNIKAVGDICPGDKAVVGLGVLHKCKKFGNSYPLEQIRGYFNEADLIIGNLEGLLSSSVEQDRGDNKWFARC